jgi:hypothetical protein
MKIERINGGKEISADAPDTRYVSLVIRAKH